MGSLSNITEAISLSENEKGAIKNLLVKLNREIDAVKTQFEQLYGKRISAQVVKSILVKNEDEIQSLQKFWYENPEQEEFFHLSVRLRRWKQLYDMALRPNQIIINTKIDKDNWGVEMREDIKAASGALKNAAWDKHTWQGLENEKTKLAGSGEGSAEDYRDNDEEPIIGNWGRKSS